jgi:hypothetical protein
MVSEIDPTVPRSPVSYASDQRKNWQAAKDEIEALQAGQGSGPLPYLPLIGGTLTGPLIVPLGSSGNPALEFGSNATGFYVEGDHVVLKVEGAISFMWNASGPLVSTPLNMNTYRITGVANAIAPTDALNQRAGDARYAPLAATHEVQRLEARIRHLEGLVDSLLASPRFEVGRGMPTTVVRRS